MLRFGVEGGGGGGRRCRKSWAYLRKNLDYAPAKAWNWTTGVLTKSPRLSSWSRITHDGMKTPRSFQRKKGVTTVVSGRSVKCNAIFAVYDLSELGFKTLLLQLLVCSPVWMLDISNIWKHHAKVRTTDIHNIVLYAKIWFHGRKTFCFWLPLTTSRDWSTWQELTA